MPYWFLDKEKDEPMIFGSLPAVAERTGYDKRKLSVHFSEKKEISWNDERFRIERVELNRTERKKSVGKKIN
jgi:hypothetical protein